MAGYGHDERRRSHFDRQLRNNCRRDADPKGKRLMKTTSAFYFTLCCALTSFSFGCSAGAKHGMVSGTVSLDGQPLKSGTIRFDAADGRTAAADATISDGRFSVSLPPGDKRVSITSPKVIGKKKMYDTPDSPIYDVTEESLPQRYNAQSTLSITVIAGAQEKDFPLTTK